MLRETQRFREMISPSIELHSGSSAPRSAIQHAKIVVASKRIDIASRGAVKRPPPARKRSYSMNVSRLANSVPADERPQNKGPYSAWTALRTHASRYQAASPVENAAAV